MFLFGRSTLNLLPILHVWQIFCQLPSDSLPGQWLMTVYKSTQNPSLDSPKNSYTALTWGKIVRRMSCGGLHLLTLPVCFSFNFRQISRNKDPLSCFVLCKTSTVLGAGRLNADTCSKLSVERNKSNKVVSEGQNQTFLQEYKCKILPACDFTAK